MSFCSQWPTWKCLSDPNGPVVPATLCLDRTPVPLADKASALSVNPDCGEGELIEVKGRASSQLFCEPTLNQSEDWWNRICVSSSHQPWACVMQAITVATVRSVKAACCPQLWGSPAKETLVNIGFAVGEPDFSSLPGGQEDCQMCWFTEMLPTKWMKKVLRSLLSKMQERASVLCLRPLWS